MNNNDSFDKVLNKIDSLKQELISILIDTVNIPSINPSYDGVEYDQVIGNESLVNRYYKKILDDLGSKTDLWEETENRENLVGLFKGKGEGKSLIFNGHVDVVPANDESSWKKTSPWQAKEIDQNIYGRGTCDMKGGNAAVIIAIKGIIEAGYWPAGDVILQFVVGEESQEKEKGTLAAITRGYKADAAIVVEPSAPPYRLGILTASPGVITLRVNVKGKSAHTSVRNELVRAGGKGSDVAVSALDKAMIIYDAMNKLEEIWGQTKLHPAFKSPGHFTICPTGFVSGINGISYIPDSCYIEYAIWHSPYEDDEQVKSEICNQIERYSDTDPWLRVNRPELEWMLWWPPFSVDENSQLVQTLKNSYEQAIGDEPNIYGFLAVCDASFLNQEGIPAIVLGPGSLRNAHAADEFVNISELIDASKIYATMICNWCGITSINE